MSGHGLTGWRAGCFCAVCQTTGRAYTTAKAAHYAARYANGEIPAELHGTRSCYNRYKCRCAPCTTANADYAYSYYHRKKS